MLRQECAGCQDGQRTGGSDMLTDMPSLTCAHVFVGGVGVNKRLLAILARV